MQIQTTGNEGREEGNFGINDSVLRFAPVTVLAVVAISASAQQVGTAVQPGVMETLAQQHPWLLQLVTWVGISKTVFHFVEARVQNWAAQKLVEIVNSPDPDDDHILLSLLSARWYRMVQFASKLFSLPLPTRADYELALAKRNALEARSV